MVKNLQSFPIFELKEKQYEPQIQLPILSNEQTNSENEKKNEIMNKDKDKDDENIIDSYDNKLSFRSSLNSIITYDSFRDDFLMNNQEQNDDINKDKSIEINEKNNNNSKEYLQPLNVKINEKKRIIKSGGMIVNGRVMGALMLTRAFGDFELSPFGVIENPYVNKTEIDLNIKNQFLIIACDGVWDLNNENEFQQMIIFDNDCESLCQKIIKETLRKDAWDNLSVFCIKLT